MDAVVRCTDVTKQVWFAKSSTAASATSFPSDRRIRNERSRCQVKPQKSDVAAKYRIVA